MIAGHSTPGSYATTRRCSAAISLRELPLSSASSFRVRPPPTTNPNGFRRLAYASSSRWDFSCSSCHLRSGLPSTRCGRTGQGPLAGVRHAQNVDEVCVLDHFGGEVPRPGGCHVPWTRAGEEG